MWPWWTMTPWAPSNLVWALLPSSPWTNPSIWYYLILILTGRLPLSATSLTSTCTNPAVNALLAVRACLGFTTSCAEWNVANWKKEKWTCWWRSVLKSNCTPSAVLPMLPSGLLKVWCVLGRRTFSRDANTLKITIPKIISRELGAERNYNWYNSVIHYFLSILWCLFETGKCLLETRRVFIQNKQVPIQNRKEKIAECLFANK